MNDHATNPGHARDYQQAPAMLLGAIVAASQDETLSDATLRAMLRNVKSALDLYQQNGVGLRDIILSAHEQPAAQDHELAKRIVTSTIACKPFSDEAVSRGELQRHFDLSVELRDYAEMIRAGELDGSEPEFKALIELIKASETALVPVAGESGR